MARHDPAGASAWFAIARDAAADATSRARLLVRLADAQRLAGDAAAAETLRAAIAIARAMSDPDLLIKCATGWTPTWSSGLPFEREERIQLLEEASSAAMAEADQALLLGRLATEMLYSDEAERAEPSPRRRWPTPSEAVTGALGSRFTSGTSTRRGHRTSWSRVVRRSARRWTSRERPMWSTGVSPLSRAAAAAVEAADLPHADAMLAELFELGDRHDLSVVTHAVTAVRAWRTGLAGDFDEAEQLVKEAGKLGRDAKLHNASYGTAMQLLCISWARGRFVDLLPILELGDAEARGRVSNRVMLSRALAAAGRREEARCVIDGVTEEELESLPKDALWSTVLIAAAEAAYMVGAVEVARVVHRLLVPFSSRVAFARNWVVEPIAFGAAIAAACIRCPDADDLFEEAVAVSVRLDAPVMRARAEIAWAWSALRRSRAGRIAIGCAHGSKRPARCSRITVSTRWTDPAAELVSRVSS